MLLDNRNHGKVIDEMRSSLSSDGRLSILSGIFSIYGFSALKKELSQLKEAQRETENFRKSFEVTLKNVQNEIMKKRIASGAVSSKRAQGKTFARTTTNKNR